MFREKDRHFQPHVVSLEKLVPEDNFYRQLDAKLDLSFVRDLVSHHYKPFGRPGIDPVVFFKLQLIMFFEDIRSERRLMKQVHLNLAMRWYIGYDLYEPVPNHSSMTRIRDRYGLRVFQQFFEHIIQLCMDANLVWGQELHFDSTMVTANAAHSTRIPRFYHQAQQHLQDRFEIAPASTPGLVSKYDGSRQLVKTNSYRKKSIYWVNPVDRHASAVDTKKLGYRLHYAVDGRRARIIMSCLVTPGEIQDNTPFLDLLWQTRFRWHLPVKQVVADARFGTTQNVVALLQQSVTPFMPLHADAKRATGKNKIFGSDRFRYDAIQDTYTCPEGKSLALLHIDQYSQRRVYRADAQVCAACWIRIRCTSAKHGRVVGHSIFKPLLDQVRAYHQTAAYLKAMRKRQVWIEPKFGELKMWHHGRRFRLRGLFKVNIEALIKATGQNIKQLLKARRGYNQPKPPYCGSLMRSLLLICDYFSAFQPLLLHNITFS